MSSKKINKIIYFDKETIQNILQERERGDLVHTTNVSNEFQGKGVTSIETSTSINLGVPFLSRFMFLITGRLDASYIYKRDSTTTITSTEISEFEKIKPQLITISNVQLYDIENSSTSLRVAGGYLRLIKGGVEGLDTNEFKAVMDSYDGYDTYKINEKQYVRFNNMAFVSNYKRNDLLTTTMTLYCIPVGDFERDRFDFINEINKMERLVSSTNQPKTIADIYPPSQDYLMKIETSNKTPERYNKIKLYDVLYACITTEKDNEKT